MYNFKLHAIVLILIIAAEMIGNISFKIGIGTIVLLPMLYALIMGIFTAPKFLKIVNLKDMNDASSLIGITLMLLMARYGTLVGPTLPEILKASPALVLQEFGNMGTMLIALPLAIFMGLGRSSVGATFSLCRDTALGITGDKYGLNSDEGIGTLGTYISGSIFGTLFYSFLAPISLMIGFHPYALAMASGMGSASMMQAATAALVNAAPAYEEQILAYSATSGLLTSVTGVYMELFLALPLANLMYKKLHRPIEGLRAKVFGKKA